MAKPVTVAKVAVAKAEAAVSALAVKSIKLITSTLPVPYLTLFYLS